ncbi:MAG: hypothetical protein AABW51_03745 [Nanoarchaeota archaeon]
MDAKEKIQHDQKSMLGDLVRTFYDFLYDGKGNPNYLVVDPADMYNSVKASDLFQPLSRRRGGFLVRSERLPFSPEVRAVVSWGRNVMLETSKVDFGEWSKELVLNKVLVHIPEKQKSVYYLGESELPLIKTRTQNVRTGKGEKDLRTALTICPDYGSRELDIATEAIDVLYNQSCFYDLDEIYASEAVDVKEISNALRTKDKGLKLLLLPQLKQLISLEQKPILSLMLRVRPQLVINSNVLRDTAQGLEKRVRREAESNPFLEVD